MLNYIKSEFYRVFHGREVYLFTGVCAALTVLFNLILYLFKTFTPDFPYGSIRYSLNQVSSSMEILSYAGACLTMFLFSEEHKSGTLKNTISFGISRNQFFTGKCIVCSVVSLFSMIVILFFYYGSAYLFLEETGGITVLDRLRGVLANLPMAFAAVILASAFLCMFKKEAVVLTWWVVIMAVVPIVTFFLGLKIDWLNKAAEWMPRNYLLMEVQINSSQYQALWDTSEGMVKCLTAGFIGMIVFYLIGLIGFRKKEIA